MAAKNLGEGLMQALARIDEAMPEALSAVGLQILAAYELGRQRERVVAPPIPEPVSGLRGDPDGNSFHLS